MEYELVFELLAWLTQITPMSPKKCSTTGSARGLDCFI